MLINGKKEISGRSFDVTNPFTKEVVDTVPITSKEQLDRALQLSYNTNTKLNGDERAQILVNLCKILKKEKKKLAELITSESGLSLKDTLHEIDRVYDVAFFSSKVAKSIDKDTTSNYQFSSDNSNIKLSVITEPLDLVVGITPFNHPMNQVAHKVFPSIAAGASMVLKPSPKTPLSALKLGEMLLKAGLEKNVLNIVTDGPDNEIVYPMINSPFLDMVTFTGGLEAGISIAKNLGENCNALKKYVPELGGCSSLIINDDADIDKSVSIAKSGCFGNSGQRCTAIRRIIVTKSIAEQFVENFVIECEKIKFGNPYDKNNDMGTVISTDAAKLIENKVNNSIDDGAKLLLGNNRKGALYPPTILDYVDIKSGLVAKETFGPVAAIIRAEDINHAITLAKNTNYKLAGAVMTKDFKIAKKISDELKVGQFNWNSFPGFRTEAAPFGGFGDSGNGMKEGVVLAAEGMRRIRTFYSH